MLLFKASQLFSLPLNIRDAGLFKHGQPPSLGLRWLLRSLRLLLHTSLTHLRFLDYRRGSQGWEVFLTGHIYQFLLLDPTAEDVCIVLKRHLLLLETLSFRLLGFLRFSGCESRVDLNPTASLSEISEQVLVDAVFVLNEESRVQLLVCPIEVVVQFEQH